MKLIFLILSLAAMAFVLHTYLNTTVRQSRNAPLPQNIMQREAGAAPPTINAVPYGAQRRAAEGVSGLLQKAKAAQDAQGLGR